MNTKRQTVWLVSMLSLMVVLSAYYLFTDTPSSNQVTTDSTKINEVNLLNATEVTKTDDINGVQTVETTETADATGDKDATTLTDPTDLTDITGAETTEDKATVDATVTDEATEAKDSAGTDEILTDEAVLKELASQETAATSYFETQQMKRSEQFSKEIERLTAITVDMKQTPEEVTKAQNQLLQLEEEQEKMSTLETELMNEYEHAVVLNDAQQWKVVVQSDKLERSQAVSILEMVISEMNVSPDQVSVQYVQ